MMDYKRLLKYAMPYKGRFVLAMIAMGIYSAVAGLLVYLSKQIMDGVFINDDPAIANVCREYVDGFDFCMSTNDPSKTIRQLQAEGLGQNEKMTIEQLEACDAALRALAD